MTREEAIKYLKELPFLSLKSNSDWAVEQDINNQVAVHMAILALEQQPCEDAISRDDALKALDYDIKSFEFKSGVSRHMNEIANLLNTIYEIQSDNIKALPPVQPKYNTSEWCRTCSEYDQDKHCCPRFNRVIRNAVEEVKKPKTGHWIGIYDGYADGNPVYDSWECSECGAEFIQDEIDFDYCPYCGVKMVEPQGSKEL
jgi:DNA-directed RNA polymerase subunit RPC12/RpoP